MMYVFQFMVICILKLGLKFSIKFKHSDEIFSRNVDFYA